MGAGWGLAVGAGGGAGPLLFASEYYGFKMQGVREGGTMLGIEDLAEKPMPGACRSALHPFGRGAYPIVDIFGI
jgi:hypothetical protein